MAKISSAAKRHKQSLVRRTRNRHIRATVRSVVKKVQTAIEESAANTPEVLSEAVSKIAGAASKGVLHKKTASRKISRLAKAAHKAGKAKA